MATSPSLLLSVIVATTLLKLAFEAQSLSHASDRRSTALKRMAAGAYGRCAVCDREIGAARLDVIPETTLCLEHKERAEREHGGGAGVPAPNAWNVES